MGSRDIDGWAERENLTPETVEILKKEGFDSLEELSELTLTDIVILFINTNLLKKQQCMRLKKAVERLKTERSLGQPMDSAHVASSAEEYQSRRTFGAHTVPIHMPVEDDSRDHSDNFCRTESLTEQMKLRAKPTERSKYSAQEEYKFSFSEKLRFLLVGKTGVGKSTTGNTILGADKFRTSVGFRSETSETEIKRGVVSGLRVEITDSPGLFDTSAKQENIAQIIAQAVALLHPGAHAFLFILKIGRFTQEEEGTYQRLIAIFDKDVTKYMVIVFTGGDSLTASGKTIEDIISTAPAGLQDILKACGGRYVVFDNMATDKKPQIHRLFQTVLTMVDENNNKRYTCPHYISIGQKMEEEIQKRMIDVERREIAYKECIKQLEMKNKLLEEEAKKAKYELEIRKIKREEEVREQEKITNREIQKMTEKVEQKLLTETEMIKQVNKLLKEKEDLEKKVLKELKEDTRKMEADEKKRKEAADQAIKDLKKSLQKMKHAHEEEMKKLKDRISRNEERNLLGRMTDGIVHKVKSLGTAVWNWVSSQ